jgi:hypothetical protein
LARKDPKKSLEQGSSSEWDNFAKFIIAGIGSRVGISYQNHVVLFLGVLGLDPELDVDAGEAFQF